MKPIHLFLAFLLVPAPAGLRAADQLSSDRLPAFSWDRVPCYMHVRKDTAFTPAEVRYLASFPLVTLEKGTGTKAFGSTEAGTLAAAKAIKAVNPAVKVLYYRNVIVHYSGYAANASLVDIPGAFLTDRAGNAKLVRRRVPAYDLTNERLRDWWLADAKQVCADPAIDGLFIDGNVKVLEPAYLRNEIGAAKKAALVESYRAMMNDARKVLGPKKLMVANLLRARFPDSGMSALRQFDGSYLEGFETTVGNIPLKDYVAKGIAAFQAAARQGCLTTFTGGLGREVTGETKNRQRTDEMRKPLIGDESVKHRFSYLLAVFRQFAPVTSIPATSPTRLSGWTSRSRREPLSGRCAEGQPPLLTAAERQTWHAGQPMPHRDPHDLAPTARSPSRSTSHHLRPDKHKRHRALLPTSTGLVQPRA